MSQNTQIWIARVVGLLVLGGLAWMLFAAVPPASQGGQYRQIGVELGQRVKKTGRIPYSYAYIADMQTKEYWPNQEPYISRIPKGRRIYILDDATLKQFKGYQRGGG
jgi:hypothetical protein